MATFLHPRILLAVLLAFAVAFGACRSDGASDPAGAALSWSFESATQPGPYAVGVTTVEMVDTTRPTAPNGDFPGSPQRRLIVEIWYPVTPATPDADRDASPDVAGAPYPLIVFAHGFSAFRLQSQTYTRHLASHGYIVVAPEFPLTSFSAPGGPKLLDIANQPGDVSFVIDRMLAMSGDGTSALHGMVDAERIGMTGHSGGAFTTLLTLYGPARDDRIDAALPISGSGCFLTDEMIDDVSVPPLLMHGSEDLLVAPTGSRLMYDRARAPRYWVDLVGGNHVRFADADIDDALIAGRVRDAARRSLPADADEQAAAGFAGCLEEPAPTGTPPITLDRQQELLRAFATPFFDAYLRGSAGAKEFLEGGLRAATEGAVRYEFESGE